MITTSDIVEIKKVLRLGNVTTYSLDNVSLFIKSTGEEKRFNATSVVNATATSQGLITFSDVSLWNGDGNYSLYITAEDSVDIDVNGTKLVKLGTGYIKKITNADSLVI